MDFLLHLLVALVLAGFGLMMAGMIPYLIASVWVFAMLAIGVCIRWVILILGLKLPLLWGEFTVLTVYPGKVLALVANVVIAVYMCRNIGQLIVPFQIYAVLAYLTNLCGVAMLFGGQPNRARPTALDSQ